jgi:succinate dehydrogenase/fumarate reductase flavoprotein subunit
LTEVVREDFDVVVIGGGMAGLVAANAALEEGARVCLVEKLQELGGSMALAGGYVWTLKSMETYREVVPHGDAEVGRFLVDDFEAGIEWLAQHGVKLGPRIDGYHEGTGICFRIEPDTVSGLVQPLVGSYKGRGGTLMLGHGAASLQCSDARGIVEVRLKGSSTTIASPCVVIATGGFQGDLELVARFITPWADRIHVRSNPGSTGDGFRMATGAGAGVSVGLSSFYGHLMPAEPARIEPATFRHLAQLYSRDVVLINVLGDRFVDESRGDAVSALALSRQSEARGFLVFDQVARDRFLKKAYLPDLIDADMVRMIQSVGGRVQQADSVRALIDGLLDFGLPAENAVSTILEFDSAAARKSDRGLSVPRAANLNRCNTPPFYAVPVQPGITFTEGGIRVNEECQALDRDATPVPGIFVAGADAGGFSNVGYAGGLAAALSTGLRAGIHAARASQGLGR